MMSAANEKAVAVFLEGKIGYLDIVPLVEATCEAHVPELKVSTPPWLNAANTNILCSDSCSVLSWKRIMTHKTTEREDESRTKENPFFFHMF